MGRKNSNRLIRDYGTYIGMKFKRRTRRKNDRYGTTADSNFKYVAPNKTAALAKETVFEMLDVMDYNENRICDKEIDEFSLDEYLSGLYRHKQNLDEIICKRAWPWYINGADTTTDNKGLFLSITDLSDILTRRGLDTAERLVSNTEIFGIIKSEALKSGIVYRGLSFSSVGELNDFLDGLKNGKKTNYNRDFQSLTIFYGVAKAFASTNQSTLKVILALDPTKLKLRGVNYSDPGQKDYEPPRHMPAGELRTNYIPAYAIKGITLYGVCNPESYIGIPQGEMVLNGVIDKLIGK